jgi:carbon-monoxide dehydrogenase large subunit
LTRTLTDYQLPNIASIPIVNVTCIETPSTHTHAGCQRGRRGSYIALGTALSSALGDARRPFGTEMLETPFTPHRILRPIERS